MRAILRTGLGLLLATTPHVVLAAGGAHVIDDSEVEAPGDCHVESWLTLTDAGGGLINVAPACTRKTWPKMEFGGFAAHGWTRDAAATTVGLAGKINLRPEAKGLGIGLSANAGFGLDRRRVETASVIVPVTIPAGDALRFNLDAGWQWARGAQGHVLFVGGQAEIAIRKRLRVMAEAFTRTRRKAGCQAGLRYTVDRDRIDIDLLAGRYLDGATPTAVTLGLTMRR